MRPTVLRWVALVCGLVLIAAACSRPADQTASGPDGSPETTELDTGVVDPEGQQTDGSGGDDGGGESSSTATSGGGDGDTGGQGGPQATEPPPPLEISNNDQQQELAVGEQIHPQSTEKVPNSWNGVTADTIKFAPGWNAEQCGVDVVAAITAAGGALPSQGRYYRSAPTTRDQQQAEMKETVKALVDYFNGATWADSIETYPNLAPLMKKYGDPQHPFYGRRLEYELVDTGSGLCPEKTTAAAKKVAEEAEAFAAFIDSYDGSPTVLADALHAQIPANRRPMMFGTLWLPDSYYEKWAPYTWTQFSSGSTIARQFASYTCSKLEGKNASRSQEGTTLAGIPYSETERKFGLLYPNRREDRDRATEFKQYLQDFCGLQPAVEKEYTYAIERAADEGQQIMLEMKQNDVTSILMLTDPVIPLFQIQQAKQIDYWPEWVFSSVGYADSSTVQRLYDQEELNKASFGVTQLGVHGGFGYGYPIPDPFLAYHFSHRVAPNGRKCDPTSDEGMDHSPEYCKAPTRIATYYYTMLPLIGGLLFAGPDLTPHNVSNGLQAYPQTRFGLEGPTTDPRPALVGAGEDQYHFIIDAVEWQWRSNYKPPYPENPNEDGWVTYPDCMRHYIQWPDQLALYWDKGGPNYNAWCGNEKYAPANSPEKDGYPRIDKGTEPF